MKTKTATINAFACIVALTTCFAFTIPAVAGTVASKHCHTPDCESREEYDAKPTSNPCGDGPGRPHPHCHVHPGGADIRHSHKIPHQHGGNCHEHIIGADPQNHAWTSGQTGCNIPVYITYQSARVDPTTSTEDCTGDNEIWDPTVGACVCPAGYERSGVNCIPPEENEPDPDPAPDPDDDDKEPQCPDGQLLDEHNECVVQMTQALIGIVKRIHDERSDEDHCFLFDAEPEIDDASITVELRAVGTEEYGYADYDLCVWDRDMEIDARRTYDECNSVNTQQRNDLVKRSVELGDKVDRVEIPQGEYLICVDVFSANAQTQWHIELSEPQSTQ